jgi:hypothetical protein
MEPCLTACFIVCRLATLLRTAEAGRQRPPRAHRDLRQSQGGNRVSRAFAGAGRTGRRRRSSGTFPERCDCTKPDMAMKDKWIAASIPNHAALIPSSEVSCPFPLWTSFPVLVKPSFRSSHGCAWPPIFS